MRAIRSLAGVAVAVLGACRSDAVSVPCTDSRSPFSLEPAQVSIAIGEQATFRRAPRVSECGTLPDSGDVEWSVNTEGHITFVSTSDSAATVQGVAEGVVYVGADLTAFGGLASDYSRVDVTPVP